MDPQRKPLQRQPSKSPVLYLSNLPYSIAPIQIEDAFHEHKVDVAHVELLKKGQGSHAKTCGLGVVTLHNPDPQHLDEVLRLMDGKVVMGRPMIVSKDRFLEDDFAYVAQTDPRQATPQATPQATH